MLALTDLPPPWTEILGRSEQEIIGFFEYMTTIRAETGRAAPARIGELPAVLQRECRNLPAVYCPPGALLIAGHSGQPTGCVGLAPCSAERTAEIKRLYVRLAYREKGSPGT